MSTKSSHRYRRPLTWLTVIFGATLLWNFSLYTSPSHVTPWNYLYNVAYALLYGFGAVLILRRHTLSEGPKKALLAIGLGLLAYTMGLLIWAAYNLILKVAIPYPSWADLFFALFYPLVAIGFLSFRPTFSPFDLKKSLLIFVPLLVVIFTVIVLRANSPLIGSGLTPLTQIFNVAYAAGDAALLALAVVIFIDRRQFARNYFLVFAAAFVCQAAGDYLFGIHSAAGTYWNGEISDLLFAISGFLLTLGVIKALES